MILLDFDFWCEYLIERVLIFSFPLSHHALREVKCFLSDCHLDQKFEIRSQNSASFNNKWCNIQPILWFKGDLDGAQNSKKPMR